MNLKWLAWLSFRRLFKVHFTFLVWRLQLVLTSVIFYVRCIGQQAVPHWFIVAVGASLQSFNLFITMIFLLIFKFNFRTIHPWRVLSANRKIITLSCINNALSWFIFLVIASLTFICWLWLFFCIRLYRVGLVDALYLSNEVWKEGSLGRELNNLILEIQMGINVYLLSRLSGTFIFYDHSLHSLVELVAEPRGSDDRI